MQELMFLQENGGLIKFKTHFSNHILHILDLDKYDTVTITNAVNNEFIEYVKEDMNLTRNPKRIFLYGTDGIVSEWKNNRFNMVNSIDLNKNGYEPFIREMTSRKEKWMNTNEGK